MEAVQTQSAISIKNILFLTDFSEPSEAALPFAAEIARGYGASLYALHVFVPPPSTYTRPDVFAASIEAEEECVRAAMQKIDSQLAGLQHEMIIERGLDVWQPIQRAIDEHKISLIVLGTHGRVGADKLLLGSVAEEIFRRSPVPVLTIGPGTHGGLHSGGRFRRVLFATDFTPASLAASPYALSLALENQARLLLVHVLRLRDRKGEKDQKSLELTVAEAIHRLYDTIPKGLELPFPAEVAVEFGDPAERILEAAREYGANLIVLGVRDASAHLGAATHLERATAHRVVAHATCPVLTVHQ